MVNASQDEHEDDFVQVPSTPLRKSLRRKGRVLSFEKFEDETNNEEQEEEKELDVEAEENGDDWDEGVEA